VGLGFHLEYNRKEFRVKNPNNDNPLRYGMPEVQNGIISPESGINLQVRFTGVVGSRWAPRSSKPVAGRVAGRGGFDSHPLPPLYP
jgi:hypothetical protein